MTSDDAPIKPLTWDDLQSSIRRLRARPSQADEQRWADLHIALIARSMWKGPTIGRRW